MRTFSRWMALAVLVGGPAAYADRNDLVLSQLGNPGTSNAQANARVNGDFKAFSRTIAAVMTSTSLTPPKSLGHAGFAVNAELGVVGLPSDVYIPTERAQTSTVLVPSIHVRKGLPFSIDLGARVGWLDRSSMFAATGEIRWAVNEGFIAWLPDIALRLHATQLLNTRNLHLTATGLDASVGKQFPLGGMVTITPYGGIDMTGVSSRSDVISFGEVQGDLSDPEQKNPSFQNLAAYKPLKGWSNFNSRFYAGGRFIGGALQIGAEVSLATVGTVDARTSNTTRGETSGVLPAVLAFNATLGLDF